MQKWEADQSSPIIPSFSDRPQRPKLSSPDAPKHPLKKDHQTLAHAFKVKSSNFLFIMPISSHIHNILSGCIDYNWDVIGNFVLYQALHSLKFQQYFSAFISDP
jgi:hypothetical protein